MACRRSFWSPSTGQTTNIKWYSKEKFCGKQNPWKYAYDPPGPMPFILGETTCPGDSWTVRWWWCRSYSINIFFFSRRVIHTWRFRIHRKLMNEPVERGHTTIIIKQWKYQKPQKNWIKMDSLSTNKMEIEERREIMIGLPKL